MAGRPLDRDDIYFNLGDATGKIVETILKLNKDIDRLDLKDKEIQGSIGDLIKEALKGSTADITRLDAKDAELQNSISDILNRIKESITVKTYGASGSDVTTMGTISSGSTSFSSVGLADFSVGQDVYIRGGVKHIKTYTITGTATANGTMTIVPVTGQPTVLSASVIAGDTADSIAQKFRNSTNNWGDWAISGATNQIVITATNFGLASSGSSDTGGTGVTIAGSNTTIGSTLGYATKITAINSSTNVITLQTAASSAGNSGTLLFHDDLPAIRAAQTALINSNVLELKFPSGTYCVSDTATLDIAKLKWKGTKAKIKFVGTSDVPILSLTTTGNTNPYKQRDTVLEGFEVFGRGKTQNTGIHFEGPNANNSVAHIIVDANIHDVKYGVKFFSNTYLVEYRGDAWNCGTCAYIPGGGVNYGENIQLKGGYYNSDLAFQIDIPGGEFFVMGASVDYNQKVAVMNNGGKVVLQPAHVEMTLTTSTQIELNGEGSSFSMVGGTFVGGGTAKSDYIVYCNAGNNGGAWFDNVYMGTLITNTDYFADVVKGVVKIDNPILNNVPNMPRFVSAKSNKLIDGGFEKASIVDEIFISSDSAAITNPLTGTKLSLSLDTTQFKTGAKSLKVTKTGGSGEASKFCIAIPVGYAKKVNYRLFYKKPGAGTGTISFVPAFAKISYNDAGVATIRNMQYQGSGTSVTFTSAAVDWTGVQTDATTVTSPAWASHYLVEVSLDWFTADSIYIDDMIFTEM
ncbi:hypothetical protein CPT_Moonbeam89 [Bacillus phage Moonbeam]|uniref:Uncharacterized protein n=1 Tax=Bacillus phage Moonbeam TaxID=1540091 RepID=A0A0A0RNC3_9CAUD|nr:hypothetical protein CPT_Moonbeam89 [Bacillus phage Moonbeam]AIW03487.1 hypothetical protein CPT_Moonbeam89 [Bacillus phage Moonbeam]